MSDLKIKKEQNINFRVEDDIKERIVELAKKENLNISAFMKKVVLEYPDLVESSKRLEENDGILEEADRLSRSLRSKLNSYTTIEFEKLFNSVRGKEYKGKQIRTESDLLKIFVKESTVRLKNDENEVELNVNDIVLQEEKKSKFGVYMVILLVLIVTVGAIIYYKKKS
jgi:uncharacterized protein (DUF1778 family)